MPVYQVSKESLSCKEISGGFANCIFKESFRNLQFTHRSRSPVTLRGAFYTFLKPLQYEEFTALSYFMAEIKGVSPLNLKNAFKSLHEIITMFKNKTTTLLMVDVKTPTLISQH